MSCSIVHNHFTGSGESDARIMTSPLKSRTSLSRRDAALDPLLIAAVAASAPHITRNHYSHDFFPGIVLPQHESSWDWTSFTGQDAETKARPARLTYASRQAPRRQRLQHASSQNGEANTPLQREMGSHMTASADDVSHTTPKLSGIMPQSSGSQPVQVKCMARTRIPTPHGSAFLHLYHNNRDTKEHLAIVIDPAQFLVNLGPIAAPHIRSRSLDAVWENETEMGRITRGAYVGRLSATSQKLSEPVSATLPLGNVDSAIPPPLIRIHSECFTGETVGSMRCDCGEQLDEAIRQISQPITISPSSLDQPISIPGRGAVIYLRQEGRGIGLLSKIRAYNLQDLGHDTVTANLMLGHEADERGYEIACAILRDLGLGVGGGSDGSVRVLTNNPDKVEALEKEGLKIAERVPMIPRSWQKRNSERSSQSTDRSDPHITEHGIENAMNATSIGGSAVYGDDLDKYLRTKVTRMGHILPLWMDE